MPRLSSVLPPSPTPPPERSLYRKQSVRPSGTPHGGGTLTRTLHPASRGHQGSLPPASPHPAPRPASGSHPEAVSPPPPLGDVWQNVTFFALTSGEVPASDGGGVGWGPEALLNVLQAQDGLSPQRMLQPRCPRRRGREALKVGSTRPGLVPGRPCDLIPATRLETQSAVRSRRKVLSFPRRGPGETVFLVVRGRDVRNQCSRLETQRERL